MTALLIIIAISLIIALIITTKNKNKQILNLSIQNQQLHSRVSQLNEQHQNLTARNVSFQEKITSLEKYEGLLDIEGKAIEIIAEADNYKKQMYEEGGNIRVDAQETLASAKTQANSIISKAQDQLDASIKESSKIIEQAEIRATEIAGNAYEALKSADEYQKTVVAMKNIIRGYGDEYLKPTFSLLDDLSEEFGHTEAGQNLKTARDRNNSLVRTEQAAKCDYAENNRRKTAIEFVLDAFNGKVDSILSKVKKDNYGILEQKIKDAYQIVNHNGRAFRNAEITTEYLSSRLDELKWAVITQELKWQEKEEQRIIREQIREEEKARKEFERAIREAEKEEQLLKKLIEKARKEIEKANEEEKASFLEKLNDLEGKLRIAEEKNQRAISMAQQTKAGNVYVISNIGSFGEDVFKIGMTRRLEPLDRVRELGDASVPFEFDVHALIYSDNAPLLERQLHKKFLKLQLNKVNPRKEFFNVNLDDVRNACNELGIAAKWTMTAEAKQYRESLAIAEAIKNDKQLEREWEHFQEEAEIEIQKSEVEAIE